ncbi:SDR family NAD(P)-dependent oxidoreductase [Oceanicella actignis]|uniref:Short-chain dehydrogenase n=1 Tax=Oceanicella actignis TaxID=1189325 RepID=A0A1M7TC27_9RHOB|nr:SDR family NAD(P)-dependent oxidoreductase [Oceanicella actignis]SET54808.1 Short-chain dehydrogenase [Oceanicella actignis]SHN68280.1 Short-chain dehydrogenase [Oceanicella actignis]
MTERALVIGASGGIGAALAEEFARRGYAVAALSRRADGLDVADPASVERVLGATQGPFARVVVATGILAPEGGRPEKSLAEIDAAAMARVFAVNAIGPALILRRLPRLLPRDAPAVAAVLTARVGSIGDNRLGGWYSYRASKAAANQIVHTAAIELARSHRQAALVALHPGTVDTPFTAAYRGRDKLPPAEAARRLAEVMDGLAPAQSGGFFDYAGRPVPW